MSNTCPECKTELKELLFSRYCPNEENHGKKASHDCGIVFKDDTVSGPAAGFKLSTNTWNLQSPLVAPHKIWLQQITFLVTSWRHNTQRRLFYNNAILYAPSAVISGHTIRSRDPDVLAYVSGQHISGTGKKTEITIVAEAPTPRDTVLELEVFFP